MNDLIPVTDWGKNKIILFLGVVDRKHESRKGPGLVVKFYNRLKIVKKGNSSKLYPANLYSDHRRNVDMIMERLKLSYRDTNGFQTVLGYQNFHDGMNRILYKYMKAKDMFLLKNLNILRIRTLDRYYYFLTGSDKVYPYLINRKENDQILEVLSVLYSETELNRVMKKEELDRLFSMCKDMLGK